MKENRKTGTRTSAGECVVFFRVFIANVTVMAYTKTGTRPLSAKKKAAGISTVLLVISGIINIYYYTVFL
jgi:hypothetical protein